MTVLTYIVAYFIAIAIILIGVVTNSDNIDLRYVVFGIAPSLR